MEIIKIIKDLVLVLIPIITAVMQYKSNKKSRKEIMNELNARLIEKDKETSNEIQKMMVVLENHKQQTCWENSMEVTSEYLKEIIGTKRYSNVSYLQTLTTEIYNYLNSGHYNLKSLQELKRMLSRMQTPMNENELYPIEIINLFNYKQALKTLDEKIKELEGSTNC